MKNALNYVISAGIGVIGVILALIKIPSTVPGDWGTVASKITPIIGFILIFIALAVLVRSMM